MNTLWLDLEATVIQEWDKPFIINEAKIIALLKEFKPRHIGIFSFAIWKEEDRVVLFDHIKPMLDRNFDIWIDPDLCPTKPEIHIAINEKAPSRFFMQGRVDFMDMFDFWGKERAFIDWIRATQKGTHILIDDMVEDCEMKFKDCHIIMKHI